jgi:nucleotide-binding universal stress UspA family protein
MAKRKVLIPLDGSEFSRQILRVVRNFFEPDDIELILFRAAFPPVLPSDTVPADMFVGGMPIAGSYEAYNRALDTTYAALDKEREQYRLVLLDELQPEVTRLREAGYTVRAQVDYGEPAQSIIDYVQDTGVDLVAMATHGRGGLGRLVMGSVAERVLRSVGVPVLLMRPQTAPAERPAASASLVRSLGNGGTVRIAAATDGSPAAQHALAIAGRLAAQVQTRLTVFVVAGEHDTSAKAQKTMSEAHAMIDTVTPRPEFVPLVGYTEEVLLQELEKRPQDLLIVGAFCDRGAKSQAAIGAACQRVVQNAPTSVLVIKGHTSDFHRVLVCADVDDEAAVRVGAQMAALLRARLDLVHVISPTAATYLGIGQRSEFTVEEALAQGTRLSEVLQGWLDRLTAEGFDRSALHLKRGSMPEAALEMAHSGRYDLIVVGSRSSAGHFPTSAANSLVRYAEPSVLVVRARR